MSKVLKTKGKGSSVADTKPTIFAKIIYAAIVRYIKAENARNRDKSTGLALDFGRERRVNMHTKDF